MTRREVDKKLKDAGWIIEHGSKHDKAYHPSNPGNVVTLPRHRDDIPIGTLKQILTKAGLK
ncbi:MAG: type II toxin-antitoxin system HicA family toxin [Oscillospiraceae bacterium]|jgi:predicted RNA binding protein YcfA (HicA-like mRNA interferase family)|nr:type II toxin-antitoxin system HicA family toxin [Oscillospiraceae bacterium]